MKPLFITFEGIEGCGKSTQSKLLKNYLEEQSYKVLLTREPGGPKISEDIRKILLDSRNSEMFPETELLLYMASRVQHTGEWILPALKRNEFVISDRYFDSTIAYQGVARKGNKEFIEHLTKFATFNLIPDITFIIDLKPEIGLSRIPNDKKDRLERENIVFHQKVRNAFLAMAKTNKRFFIIDGNKSIKDINKLIIQKIISEGKNED
jgi:dTMP kinase